MKLYVAALTDKILNDVSLPQPTKNATIVIIRAAPENEPEAFMQAVEDGINGAGEYRVPELAKFVHRCRYTYMEDTKGKTLTPEQKEILALEIVTQRRMHV